MGSGQQGIRSTRRRLCRGPILASLMMFCGACASNPERPPVTKIVPVPPELTAPVPAPQLEGDTNADLVSWIERWREALREANRRLHAIEGIKP